MASHKKLADWYAQLGQHLEAGVPLVDALLTCEGVPRKGRKAMSESLKNGLTIEEVMISAPKWLPQPDRQFIVAASHTGNLPQAMENLSDRHRNIGSTKSKVALSLIYPLGIFHVAALLYPIVQMIDFEVGFQWDTRLYLIQAATIIVPLWLFLLGCLYLARSGHSLLPRFLSLIPFLRKYVRMQALADFSYSLGTFISAGVPVPRAWRLSSEVVRDRRFKKATTKLEPIFESGNDPADELSRFRCFPADFCSFYKTGSTSGKLDTNLIAAGRQYQERANTAMALASRVYPSLFLAIIAGFAVFSIIRVFANYLKIFDQFL